MHNYIYAHTQFYIHICVYYTHEVYITDLSVYTYTGACNFTTASYHPLLNNIFTFFINAVHILFWDSKNNKKFLFKISRNLSITTLDCNCKSLTH